jgi:fucose permease
MGKFELRIFWGSANVRKGFSYGLLDVLNSHFQTVLSITKLQSTGLQVMYFGGGLVSFHTIKKNLF